MWLNGGAFCDSKEACLDRCDPNHDGVSPLFLPKEIKKELSQEVDNHLCTADNRPSIHSNYSFFSPEPQNPLHDYWCLMIILMILMMTRMILTTTRIILMMTRMISTMTSQARAGALLHERHLGWEEKSMAYMGIKKFRRSLKLAFFGV